MMDETVPSTHPSGVVDSAAAPSATRWTGPRQRTPARGNPRGWRRWVFRLVAATVLPTLLFAVLELGLRIFGYGYPTSFFLKSPVEGRDVFIENRQFGRRFFPRGLVRSPPPLVMPAAKPDGTYRVFVLGSSAALGFPDASFSFARQLEVMLRDRYPGTRFEVVNTAMTAINSNVIRLIARECARKQPDLFVVYLGNNEVLGPFGAGSVLGPFSPNQSLVRGNIGLKFTRTGQLVHGLCQAVSGDSAAGRRWGGMAMFLDSQVRADDPRLPVLSHRFRRNLEDICSACGDSGAPVLLCTIATNLRDSAPFASLHRVTLSAAEAAEWEPIYQAGAAAESAGDYHAASDRYQRAAQIDDQFAELQFRLGRCLWALEDFDQARRCYIRARDLDTLRFRADSPINDTIRTVAASRRPEQVCLVDVERVFEQQSDHAVPGENLFYEHVHMNFSGNYLLARTVFERIVGILPDSIQDHAAREWVPLSEQQCAERLAFTGWNRWKLAWIIGEQFKQAPFTHQLDRAERDQRTGQQLEELREYTRPEALRTAAGQYRQAIQSAGDDDWVLHRNFAELLEEVGATVEAIEQWRRVIRQLPHSADAHNKLAVALASQARLDAAAAHCSRAIELDPQFAEAHVTLGAIRAAERKFSEASAEYSKALRINPNLPEAHNNLGIVLAEQGKCDEAMAAYTRALHARTDYAEAHYNIANVLSGQDRFDEAIRHYSEALGIKPDYASAHNNLGAVLVRIGKLDEALEHYSEALRIRPELAGAHYNMGDLLAKQGRVADAIAAYREALRWRPGWPEALARLADLERHDSPEPSP